jgi:hypothetical protein
VQVKNPAAKTAVGIATFKLFMCNCYSREDGAFIQSTVCEFIRVRLQVS